MKTPRKRLEAAAKEARVEAAFLEQCVACGAVELEAPGAEPSPWLTARLRRLQRICLALEMDALAASIIVDLLDRLQQAERELGSLRDIVQNPPAKGGRLG